MIDIELADNEELWCVYNTEDAVHVLPYVRRELHTLIGECTCNSVI